MPVRRFAPFAVVVLCSLIGCGPKTNPTTAEPGLPAEPGNTPGTPTAPEPPSTHATSPGKPDQAQVPSRPINRLLVSYGDTLVLMGPDGKNQKALPKVSVPGQDVWMYTLSPDGKTLAIIGREPQKVDNEPGFPPLPEEEFRPGKLYLRGADDDKPTATDVPGLEILWSPDSTELLVWHFAPKTKNPYDVKLYVAARLVNAAKKTHDTLVLHPKHIPQAYTPDGTGYVTSQTDNVDNPAAPHTISRDRKTVTKLAIDTNFQIDLFRLSPDGKTILFLERKPGQQRKLSTKDARVFVQPIGGKATEVIAPPKDGVVLDFRWSPDGKQVAYTWRRADVPGQPRREGEDWGTRLVVCNADGSGEPVELLKKESLVLIDWR